MNLFAEIEALKLPPSDFIVVGSGVLAALHIRPANDIDLLVTPQIFEQLKQRGWKYEIALIAGFEREKLSHSFFEAFMDFKVQGFDGDIRIGSFTPTIVRGINFLPLATLREIKLGMKRDKDIADIALIDEYLQANP